MALRLSIKRRTMSSGQHWQGARVGSKEHFGARTVSREEDSKG